ncbi:MAG: hypothetical protein ACFFAL_05870 [Promethearchaeota archaeon]
MTRDDETIELHRITILERNAEYYAAAKKCFALYQRSRNPEYASRGFDNLYYSAWRANSHQELTATLQELVILINKALESDMLREDHINYMQAILLEAEGWLADTPSPERLEKATKLFVKIGKISHALDLIPSLVAFEDPDDQVYWTKYGIELTTELPVEKRDAYYLLLIEPLLLYAEGEDKKTLLAAIFQKTEALSQVPNRSHIGNIAVLNGLDLIHPFRIEPEKAKQILHNNVHELVRALSTVTHNRLRGMILSLLGRSFYRMAETENDPEIRQELYKKAKDYFLESVVTLERTPAYGELLHAYTLAGTGFLSIAELEQNFEQRNEFYRLGEEHLRKSREIGEKTQLYQLRARAAINLGVALERVTWFDMNHESRKERLKEIYNLQLEGRDLAQKTKSLRGAGYATMNASEMCGFLSDLETRTNKKTEWAIQQRDLSQTGLALLEQTQDLRGQLVALSYAAFACAKLANLSPRLDEKQPLYEEMLSYGGRAIEIVEKVPDPVATAYAFDQAGDAAQHLGIITGNAELLTRASKFYEKAIDDWAKTGESHKRAQSITKLANNLLFLSSLDFTPAEPERQELLEQSTQYHFQAAELFTKLFFFHDVGENYWRIGQIHLLKEDFQGAQEYFDKVQKSFDQVSELVPDLAEVYSIFRTYGVTLVGLIDGLNIINRGDHAHAAKLFDDLAKGLSQETDRNLRYLRQLLVALTSISQYAANNDIIHRETAEKELNRLLSQLNPDAYEQMLPFSLQKTIHRLQIFLIAPKLFFPPILLDLPLQEKMLAITQTRHIVSTALSLYQSTAGDRDVAIDEPSENVLRNYVARISSILEER